MLPLGPALTACGNGGDAAAPTAAADDGSGTITVEHAGGTTGGSLAPERIVTLDGHVDLQTLVVLGVAVGPDRRAGGGG